MMLEAVARLQKAFDAYRRRRGDRRDDHRLRLRRHLAARRPPIRRRRCGAGGVGGALRRVARGRLPGRGDDRGGRPVVVRWRYTWGDGHVRGVDVFTVRDGLVAEKLAYVKG